ncbi:hypothetical protein BpHYR1_046742 [Brachionus plicatilis]|uniref:Uncharacterized protein n=1 Tax=Brachionus plicatilis TaxID=10195 RepID=A0A3M7PNW6_BRAPC|nr:hypothetical protein BpHYR1_046742 [Brachionus plicatilis]
MKRTDILDILSSSFGLRRLKFLNHTFCKPKTINFFVPLKIKIFSVQKLSFIQQSMKHILFHVVPSCFVSCCTMPLKVSFSNLKGNQDQPRTYLVDIKKKYVLIQIFNISRNHKAMQREQLHDNLKFILIVTEFSLCVYFFCRLSVDLAFYECESDSMTMII